MKPTTDERLRRLETIALLDIAEKHGLRAGLAVDIPRLRAEALRDAVAIARERSEPVIERRAA